MGQRGLTLIELLAVLALAAVLLALAAPGWEALRARQISLAALQQLIAGVNAARQTAITQRSRTVLCAVVDGRCGGRGDWHHGAKVFVDRNRNAQQDPSEPLVARLAPFAAGTRIFWRSFRNRGYLAFDAYGLTEWQNGHFLYCPPDGDPRFAREIILNSAGRVRIARDRDGDGIHEDARGAPLRCP